jgi:nucleoside phosphorylase
MGQAPATLAADRMIGRLGVSLVVLVGTAGGLDSDVRLGDVVVADQIQEYLRKAKVVPGAAAGTFTFERAAESWRTNSRLVDHVRNLGWLPAGAPALAAWRKAAVGRWPGGAGEAREPTLHVGPVATGDVVVAADSFATWIRASNRKLVALDMEAAGAALAAYHNDCADFLVIRGVSDHADEQKAASDAGRGAAGVGDAWRQYAVRNAIEYLVVLLSSSGFPWRDKPDDGVSARPPGSVFPRVAATAAAVGVAGVLGEEGGYLGTHHDSDHPDGHEGQSPGENDGEHQDPADSDAGDADEHYADNLIDAVDVDDPT